jgi:purine-binding chemotaxis protein CheW
LSTQTELDRFDWQSGYERLARAMEAVDTVAHPPPEMSAEILHRRGYAIAAPKSVGEPALTIDLVGFSFCDRKFAADADQVDAVVNIGAMVSVPSLPSPYLGLIYSRGEVYPVLDLAVLFGMPRDQAGVPPHALLIVRDDVAIAIAADRIVGLSRVDHSTIVASEENTAPHVAIRGFTADATIVFCPYQLLLDSRLCVDAEPVTRICGGTS